MDETEGVWQMLLALNRPNLAWAMQKLKVMEAKNRDDDLSCVMRDRMSLADPPMPSVITATHFLPRRELPYSKHV